MQVVGATIERYLLEKSRLVGQREGENNFHVFYYLLSGAPAQVRDGLGMLEETHYNYLHHGGHLLEADCSSKMKARRRCSSKYEMPGAGTATSTSFLIVFSRISQPYVIPRVLCDTLHFARISIGC